MQLTVAEPGFPETAITLTLHAFQGFADDCCLCSTRQPLWFTDPASNAAMNPDASPIGGPACCAQCLNHLLDIGTITILNADPESF